MIKKMNDGIKFKQFLAFTLAEVLIVIGIIGIVAQMTIPTLVNNVQDKVTITAYKKAYSVANQAYTMAVTDNGTGLGVYNDSGNTNAIVKFNALKSQLKVVQACPYGTGAQGKCWSNSGVGLKNYFVSGCGCTSNDGYYQNMNESFTTADGMFWMLYTYTTTTGCDFIFVDVNGDKKPNDWGKDVFMFELNDTNITPVYSVCTNLKHNDGTSVNNTEFSAPLMK